MEKMKRLSMKQSDSPITIRVSKVTKEKIRKDAYKNNASLSYQASKVVEEYYAKRE